MAQAKAQIITIGALKGGTAKTATAGAMAQTAAHCGLKVLAVDLDPQASLSQWLRADLTHKGSYDLLEKGAAFSSVLQKSFIRGLHVISSSAQLTALHTQQNGMKRLAKALKPQLANYDIIIIDTAPRIDEGLNNALYASTDLIIPIEADTSGIQAMYQMLDVARRAQETQPRLTIQGVIVTRYDNRPKINRYMLDQIKQTAAAAGTEVLGTIRQSVAIREAMALQANLYEYAPTAKPVLDYHNLLLHTIHNRK